MNQPRVNLSLSDRQRAARLPVALPVRAPVPAWQGFARARRALALVTGAPERVRTDEDLLAAYTAFRQRTGLHPADAWLAWQAGSDRTAGGTSDGRVGNDALA